MEVLVADEKGKGSKTARKANAKASKEGKKNPRTSSAAQSELGKGLSLTIRRSRRLRHSTTVA